MCFIARRCSSPICVSDFHANPSQMKPYMLRRLKEDVEDSVPPKEETRVKVELTNTQKRYYRALYEKNLNMLNPKVGLRIFTRSSISMNLSSRKQRNILRF